MVMEKVVCKIAADIQVEEILHMNGGEGNYSYANNSVLQKTVILKAKPLIQESVAEIYTKCLPTECFTIADLGCSSGPSAYMPTWEIVKVLHSVSQRLNRRPPLLQAFLNDLPGNDFNSTFKLLPSFYERLKEKSDKFAHCFVAAVPGSFYGRLFRPNALHFIFSSYSLHWLSQVPKGLVNEFGVQLNKEDVYLGKTCSAPEVHKAYLDQFESDFTTFLKLRFEELKPGGHMVLTLMGNDKHYSHLFKLIGMVIKDMVSEGLIEESKLESFNFPFYSPSAEEVRQIIEREGSFNIHKLETFHLSWLVGAENVDNKGLGYARGKHVANRTRAVSESLLANHFGNAIIDGMFHRLSIKVTEYLEMGLGAYTNLLISLEKK